MHSSYSNNILDSHNKNRFFVLSKRSFCLFTFNYKRLPLKEIEKERFDVKNFLVGEKKYRRIEILHIFSDNSSRR